MEEELHRRKEEQKRRDEERKRQLMEKYKQMEKDLEDEHQKELKKTKEREAEKERLRKQQLEERDKRQRDEIKKSNLGEDEKARLLREHQDNIDRLANSMQQEQDKSKSTLNERLEARRKRRLLAEKAKLQKGSLMESDQEQKDALAQRTKEGALQSSLPGSQDKTGADAFGLSSAGPAGSQGVSSGLPSSGSVEQDWMNLLMASPLFKQINDLADMLDANSDGAGPLNRVMGKFGGWALKPYVQHATFVTVYSMHLRIFCAKRLV